MIMLNEEGAISSNRIKMLCPNKKKETGVLGLGTHQLINVFANGKNHFNPLPSLSFDTKKVTASLSYTSDSDSIITHE